MKSSPFSIILIFVILIIIGIALVPLLPFKLKPTSTLPSLSVNYTWSGADARIIEQEVTKVLEGLFSRIRGVVKTTSVSSIGSGNISVDFDKTVNADALRFEVATLIRQVYPTFPRQVSYPQIYIRNSDDERVKPLLSYTLNAPATPYVIQKYAENKISKVLATIRGIEKINVYGAMPMEWVMEYNADLMKIQGITPMDVQRAIGQYFSTSSAGIGYETMPGRDTTVTHLVIRNYQAKSVDLLNIPVKRIGGRVVYIKELVKMRRQEQEPNSYYRINGDNTINIVILAGELENQLRISSEVKTKLAEIEKNLPSGYSLLNSFDATDFIKDELKKNIWRAVLTIAILLIIVLLITRSWRYLLLIILSLTANLSIAAIFYYLFKIEMHVYSLAGITVSLSLIKNNSIVMIDHMRHQKNLKAFMAILAATLTSIAALIIAFFLDDMLKVSLLDFSIIMIINLTVSLFVALLFIPALMQKMPLTNKSRINTYRLFFFKSKPARRFRFTLKIIKLYEFIIKFICRFKWAFIILFILGFGLPVNLLPEKIEGESWAAGIYNKTFGSDKYKSDFKPLVDKYLGGTMQLFNQNVMENSYYGEIQKTTLYANAHLPFGATLEQMNELVKLIEIYLKRFKEIAQFESYINSGRAYITIYFKKNAEDGGFPFQLKGLLTQKALSLGGADWNIYGVGDQGFSNEIHESTGNYNITMYGYNYDILYGLAERTKAKLLKNQRIKEVSILSHATWEVSDVYELVMDFDLQKLSGQNISSASLYSAVSDYDKNEHVIGTTIADGEAEQIRIQSQQSVTMDLWNVQHEPGKIGKTIAKINAVSNIKKTKINRDIEKENQQYRLVLAYDYIGQYKMAERNQKKVIDEISPTLPLGFTIKNENHNYSWNTKTKRQYGWLFLIILIIFFICSVLFESLLLPLAVIFMIPISYIGVFLTFTLFELNFDQGGFAAFILLSGITVNAALYVINDFNILKRKHERHNISTVRLYLKAYNQKIFPIILTIISTTLGLVPFLFGGQKEVFWPAMAAGTIGGLLFSLIALWIYLPLVLVRGKMKKVRKY